MCGLSWNPLFSYCLPAGCRSFIRCYGHGNKGYIYDRKDNGFMLKSNKLSGRRYSWHFPISLEYKVIRHVLSCLFTNMTDTIWIGFRGTAYYIPWYSWQFESGMHILLIFRNILYIYVFFILPGLPGQENEGKYSCVKPCMYIVCEIRTSIHACISLQLPW